MMLSKWLLTKIMYVFLDSVHKLQGDCNCSVINKDSSYGECKSEKDLRNRMIKTSTSICLHIPDNGILTIKPETFKRLNSLKQLKIHGLSNIEDGTFKYLTSLIDFNLASNCLENISTESFLGLKSLKYLRLHHNRLYKLQPGTFQHLTSLRQLYLFENCIKNLDAQSFLGLKSLEYLHLSNNSLVTLHAEIFLELKSLQALRLSHNKLTHLKGETFKYLNALTELYLDGNQLQLNERSTLANPHPQQVFNISQRPMTSLSEIHLSQNDLTEVHFNLFPSLYGTSIHSLKNIYLNSNLIHTCFLSTLKQIEMIHLDNNKLVCIHKVMFEGLISLQYLYLENNHIQIIETKAFKDLKSLEELHLDNNNLTWLQKEFIFDLTSLQLLTLHNNPIKVIEEGAFHWASSIGQLQIFLSSDKISPPDFTWKIYLKSPFNEDNLVNGKDNFKKIEVAFVDTYVECVTSLCWIQKIKSNNIFDVVDYDSYDDGYGKYILKKKCDESFKYICPKTDKWCMNDNSTRCLFQCLSSGYPDGNLVFHKYFCPFQHFCSCLCNNCAKKCARVHKVQMHQDVDIFGCDICNCQCEKVNCWMTCKGYNFQEVNNTHGCLECNCTCPDRDCNANCEGEGNDLVTYDADGCIVCGGCRYDETNGNSKRVLIPTLLLSVLVMGSAVMLVFFIYRRNQKKENRIKEETINTGLNILTKNLDPVVAQQVKESWYEPKALRVNHMLGNGQFGIVWSAIFEKSLGRKFPVAVKVAKAEYKDVWAVDTKWNSNHELKPHFEKLRVQTQLNNQVIKDLLLEALIMKKFRHSNILNMIGISMYEDKPCIILPLMQNGDLKKYLLTNKSRLANPDLTAFALGVTKGMVYLAEEKFVHCDLAARNCMLDAELMVKISDFGLTRGVNNKEWYHENTKTVLPTRWMSTEAIKFGKFTLQSDMWSLGVVMWEIFSCGEFPYKGIENTNILEFLMNGNRLGKPENCPDNMYYTILKCWNKDPEKRPSAYVMLDIVNRIADKESNYTEVKDEPVEAQTNDKIMECSTQVEAVITK